MSRVLYPIGWHRGMPERDGPYTVRSARFGLYDVPVMVMTAADGHRYVATSGGGFTTDGFEDDFEFARRDEP